VPGFLGGYLHQLDTKGRVSLPALYRKGRQGQVFVLIKTQPDALSLYPREEWRKVEKKLREISRRHPKRRNQVLRVTAGAVEVIPDKQGRILIPEKLRNAISLQTEAMVAGAIDHIEIWEPGRFDEMQSQTDDELDEQIEGVFA